MQFKEPRSVLVVIFADCGGQRRYLLLRRARAWGGFWQSVTGSLEPEETHRQAAVREVLEETGISCVEADLIDLGLTNTFTIASQWRSRYAPHVTDNEEVCFALRTGVCSVRLNSAEHDQHAWVDYDTALRMLYWDSNRRALAAANRLV
jgi:dATP pyrophosphohydrolase